MPRGYACGVSEQVARRIREAIDDHGPIPFAEFMELALYGPGGFYERPPVGERGHFVTSPHVHPVFADLLRLALLELRRALGEPEPFPVVELGAGDGTLARQLIESFADVDGVALAYAAVEVSAGARAELARSGFRVEERLSNVPQHERACVLANELVDNLPFRRLRSSGSGPVEVRIGLNDGAIVEVEAAWDGDPADVPSVMLDHPDVEVLVPVGAMDLLAELAAWARERSVYVLLIDYGIERETGAAEVHGYRDHRIIADVLADPGETDITAGVDFERLAQAASACGFVPLGSVSQRDALLALGYRNWEDGQLARQSAAFASRVGRDAIGAWQSRMRARLLVDGAGLGRLRWLVLATPGLPAPRWLERALEHPSAPR